MADRGRDKKEDAITKKASWMVPISHGYHVVERQQSFSGGLDDSDCDSVVVQREQIEEIELWFFGVFNAQVGDRVTKYLQSHLFGRKMKEVKLSPFEKLCLFNVNKGTITMNRQVSSLP